MRATHSRSIASSSRAPRTLPYFRLVTMSREAPTYDDRKSVLCFANDLVRRAAREIALRVSPRGFAACHEAFDKGNRLRIVRHNGRCATRRRLGFGILGHARIIREIASASPELRGPA